METRTTNPENWVSESITYEVDAPSGLFQVHGETFYLGINEEAWKLDNSGDFVLDLLEGGKNGQMVGQVIRFRGSKEWEAFSAGNYDMSRTAKDRFEAAVKLIANLY